MSSLQNAIPKLIGTDTHAASLTGSVVINDSTGFSGATGRDAQWPPNVGCPIGEEIVATTPITITEPINRVVISSRWFTGTDGFGREQRFRARLNDVNGTILGSIIVNTAGKTGSNTNAAEATIRVIAINVPLSTTNIVLTREHIGTLSCTSPVNSTYSLDTYIIEINDTHAANLTGSNTLQSHEQEVLP